MGGPALANNQERAASEYYERYADAIRITNPAAAIHHYSLALSYEKGDLERGRSLLKKIVSLNSASPDMMMIGDSYLGFTLCHRDKLPAEELRHLVVRAIYYFTAFCKGLIEKPSDDLSQNDLMDVDSALRKAQIAFSILSKSVVSLCNSWGMGLCIARMQISPTEFSCRKPPKPFFGTWTALWSTRSHSPKGLLQDHI